MCIFAIFDTFCSNLFSFLQLVRCGMHRKKQPDSHPTAFANTIAQCFFFFLLFFLELFLR